MAVARGAVLAVVLLSTAAAPAWASFPGRNGAIAYQVSEGDRYSGHATSIRTVVPRSGQVRVLRECLLRTTGPDCSLGSPRYSPDGLRIAFPIATHFPGTPEPSRTELGILASDGTRFESHTTANLYSRPAWSPRGNQFLLQRSGVPEDGPAAMVIASLEGTELRHVSPGAASGRTVPEPDWSSRGEIAFVSARAGCVFPCKKDIYVTRVGATPRRLTLRGGESPSWSPNGSKLAFVRRASPTASRGDIYTLKRNGRGLRRLTRGFSPTWSPDGKWIAFTRGRDLHLIRPNGKRRHRLLRDVSDGTGKAVDWQPLPR